MIINPYSFGAPVSYDADAQTWFDSIVTNGGSISVGNKNAANTAILALKATPSLTGGVSCFTALKELFLLAGPLGVLGALTPLKGPACTNFNFIDADQTSAGGLLGNGTSKYLLSGRAGNTDPQNNNGQFVWVHTPGTFGTPAFLGNSNTSTTGTKQIYSSSTAIRTRQQNTGTDDTLVTTASLTGFIGMARIISSEYRVRLNGANYVYSKVSQTPLATNLTFFGRMATNLINSRLAIIGDGEAIDMPAVDAILATYMASIT